MPLNPATRTRGRVLAIRHGESEWNAVGRWQGQADPPLTAFGREQAAAAGEVLAQGEPFGAIVASDLQRAAATATIIGGVIGTEVAYLDRRFRENHAGEWEGLTRVEIERDWPGYLEDDARPPTFETAEATEGRMRDALVDAVARTGCERLLVVGHSGAIRSLRRVVGGEDHRLPNLGGFWFDVDGAFLRAGDTVELMGHHGSVIE